MASQYLILIRWKSSDMQNSPDPAANLPLQTEQPIKRRRHILLRLFGISLWGWIKLFCLCVLVGFFVIISQAEPEPQKMDLFRLVAGFARSALSMGRWALTHFWQPALAGASLVLPLWFLWRVISLPFRK